ncbi:hypothetical protein FGO68_gene2726 [Halteria grandinella]|uniref:RanBD1 domain-containing protein n=1 Tax=Halteria grandinella TaxID=5974 RepID=A0A8J8NID7_HALGN|nr:hypothetical protein FGO68_gene2726 [Halteria grandinella]
MDSPHSPHDIDYTDGDGSSAPMAPLAPYVPVTGEENEDLIMKLKCKLYRYKDEEWKERATGYLKILRHKQHPHKIRMIVRQDKIFKIRAHFIISESPMCDIVLHSSNDKTYLWRCHDFSDTPAGVVEYFSCKFLTQADAITFRDAFTSAKLFNSQVKEEVPTAQLVFAPVWNNGEEQALPYVQVGASALADPEQNKEPDEEDHQDGFDGEDP